jgi:hypothetical protein
MLKQIARLRPLPQKKPRKDLTFFFWGLLKSKNYMEVGNRPVKMKIECPTLDSVDNGLEKKQALWGAIQWTEKKKSPQKK